MKNKIKLNKKLIVLFSIILALFTSIILLNKSSNIIFNNAITNYFKAATAVVKSLDYYVVDGQAPFEDNDNPGNDSSADNKIVRSNDILVYTLQPFVENKNAQNSDLGNIVFEAKLPKQKLIFWDVEEIKKWAKDDVIQTEDNDNYYLKITKAYNEIVDVTSGNSTLNIPFSVKVSGAKNATEIKPEFTVYMEGEEASEKKHIIPDTVRVSSEKRYAVDFSNHRWQNDRIEHNGKQGRLIAFGAGIYLKNDSTKTGLKGIEFPDGKFELDIEYNNLFLPNGVREKEANITNVFPIELYNYHMNNDDPNTPLKIPENKNVYRQFFYYKPVNQKGWLSSLVNTDGEITAGDVNATHNPTYNENGSVNIEFTDFKVDEKNIFPEWNTSSKNDGSAIPNYHGYVNYGTFFVFVPFPEKEWITNYANDNNIPTNDEGGINWSLHTEILAKNIKYVSNDGKESKLEDRKLTYSLVELIKGYYSSQERIFGMNHQHINITNHYSDSTNMVFNGQSFLNGNGFTLSENNDKFIYGFLAISKFDSRYLEITDEFKSNDRLSRTDQDSSRWLYFTKKDGSNWNSDEEMNSSTYLDLNVYPTIEEAQNHGVVVAWGLQAKGKNDEYIIRNHETITIKHSLKAKENAPTGTITQFVNEWHTYFRKENSDTFEQDGGNILTGNFVPSVSWKNGLPSRQNNYRKLELDESYNQVVGTHGPNGIFSGNSLLIIDVKPKINITPEKSNTYNLTLGEKEAIFKLQPSIETIATENNNTSEIRKMQIKAILPKGLTYKGDEVLGGTYNSNTNTVEGGIKITPESIKKNDDGTTEIIYIVDTKLNKNEVANKTIHFKTEIPMETLDKTNFELSSEIEIIGSAKTPLADRKHNTSISIINLLAQVAIKDLDQQVIENSEKFIFNLKYLNQGKTPLSNVYMLDILPYNNDNRGTSFNGTYNIQNITSSLNYNIYYTTDVNIRTKTAQNFKQDSSINWIRYTGGEISNSTAIYTEGRIEAQSNHTVTFELKPVGSKTGDIYGNRQYTYVPGQLDTLDTPVYKGIIAKRTITGKVFKDINLNGIRESSEQLLSGKTITLLTENGQRVQRVDGTFVDPVTTNSNGEYTFEDVPSLSNMKIKITLDNTEEITKVIADNKANLDGYINNISMLPAINLIENNALEVKRNQDFGITPKISITANKIWVGGSTTNRPSIQLQLKKDGVNLGAPVTVTTANGQTTTSYTWNNLDITNNTGKYYEYTVDEVNVPQNYAKSLSANKLTITNTYTVPQISFTGTKKFIGGENSRPEFVELKILRNGQEIPGLENNGIKRIFVNGRENIYTAVWNNLDKTDSNGVEYNYTVEEINVPTNYRKTFENNNKTVVNTYVSPKTSFKASKVWVNGEEVRPNNIKLQLYRNSIAYKDPVIVSKESNTAIWNDLDLNDETGNLYTYTVDELEVPNNFVKTLSNVTKTQNVNNQTITNTYSIPKVNITGTKNWVGGENVRPNSIKLQLYKDGQVEGEAVDLLKTETSKTWENLPKTDSRGRNFVYTVDEVEVVDNFVKKVVNTATGTIITNTFESPKTDITVTKNWVNGEELRKDIQIQLLRNGQNYKEPVTIKKDSLNNNTGTYTFTNLDKMDNTGTNYIYTAKEITVVENFVKRENGLNITNEYQIPKIDIRINKKWKNWYANKEKPEYGIQLYKDEQPVGNVIMLKEDTYTFKQLDKTDITGREYNYEVKEVIVPKYFEKTETKISNTEHELVNTYIPPVMEVYVNKVWVNGNQENRPEIEFVLYGNTTVVASAKLENGQTSYIFKDIPKFDNEGEEIAYMIKEKINEKEYIAKNNIKYDFKYDSSIEKIEVEDDLKQVFEATNEYIIPKTKFNVRKLWVGDNKENRPSIQIQLYQNGMKYKKPITLTKDETEYTWEDLDATNKYQEEYVYTADEVNVPNGYDKKVLENGAKIINIKKTVNGYLPFAGLKENTQIGIVLILIASIVYLRNSKKNYITANKRTKLSNMNIRRKK